MEDIKQPWILTGYELFAKDGPSGLRVDVIAREIKKSRSSFYHHFADQDIFMDRLLDYHLIRTEKNVEKERLCRNIDPDLFNIFIDNKIDLLFNRQLRVYRNDQRFKKCFEKTTEMTVDALAGIWKDNLGLSRNSKASDIIFRLSVENFYLQITEENLNHSWLRAYMDQLKLMVRSIREE